VARHLSLWVPQRWRSTEGSSDDCWMNKPLQK
jgi:hypothetical protein